MKHRLLKMCFYSRNKLTILVVGLLVAFVVSATKERATSNTCDAPCLFFEDINTCPLDADSKVNNSLSRWKCPKPAKNEVQYEDLNNDRRNYGFKMSNGTKQWLCKFHDALEASGETNLTVVLANETWLFSLLHHQNQSSGCCLVFFFVRWCKFCTEIAVDYNALARSYPGLPIIAVDAGLYPSVATKYGVVGVPTILLFYGGRPVMRLNKSSPDLHQFKKFIKHHAGFAPESALMTSDEDYLGPLPTKVEETRDIYLYLSTLFLLFLCAGYLSTLPVVSSFLETTWNTLMNSMRHPPIED